MIHIVNSLNVSEKLMEKTRVESVSRLLEARAVDGLLPLVDVCP